MMEPSAVERALGRDGAQWQVCAVSTAAKQIASYIVFTIKHVAIFSYKGKQQYNCKCSLQGLLIYWFGVL